MSEVNTQNATIDALQAKIESSQEKIAELQSRIEHLIARKDRALDSFSFANSALRTANLAAKWQKMEDFRYAMNPDASVESIQVRVLALVHDEWTGEVKQVAVDMFYRGADSQSPFVNSAGWDVSPLVSRYPGQFEAGCEDADIFGLIAWHALPAIEDASEIYDAMVAKWEGR